MVRPDQYICELLFTNDCVIIPGLGGFVSNTRSTFLNPSQHTFTPPSKKVAFNSSLRTNDGLLAHYISQEENITYHEANEIISNYVDDVFRKLSIGEQISIEEVGTLSMDLERNIQFDPEPNANFLLSSFGMNAIHSPAIKREEVKMEVVNDNNTTAKPGVKRRKKLWKIIELVPAAAVLAIMIFNPKVVHTLNNNLGNIISLPAPKVSEPEESTTVKKVEIPAVNQVDATTEATPIKEENDSFNQKMIEETAKALQEAFDRDVEEKTRKILAEENTAKVVSPVKENNKVLVHSVQSEVTAPFNTINTENSSNTDDNSNAVLKKFHVIGGVFSIKDNAYNYVNKAKADGYPAVIAGKNKRGYWVVSIASANSEEDLQQSLQTIQASYEKNAWVYKK